MAAGEVDEGVQGLELAASVPGEAVEQDLDRVWPRHRRPPRRQVAATTNGRGTAF